MLTPIAWLGMVFATGQLGGATPQVLTLRRGEMTNDVSFMAAVSAVLSFLVIVFCARHWKREHAGFGKSTTTFAIIVGAVGVYYGILAIWFWNMTPTPLVSG